MMKTMACEKCTDGLMVKTTNAEHNRGMQIFGIAVFLLGLGLLFLFPIGTIIGIFVMLAATRMGYSKKKVWKCKQCGYFFSRA